MSHETSPKKTERSVESLSGNNPGKNSTQSIASKNETKESQSVHTGELVRRGDIDYIHCQTCDKDIPLENWPNHRDRLRKVVVDNQLSSFKRKCCNLVMDIICWILANVFFRDVAVCGSENIPKTGPVIFYGNHQNQFLDALMVNAYAGRRVRFIVAEKSANRPVIKEFANMCDAVPVVRPQDVPNQAGSGRLQKTAENVVTGQGTAFRKELNPGDVIIWNVPAKEGSAETQCRGQVLSIESDTTLTLTLPIPCDDNHEPASFKISRRIDHSEMYAMIYDTLAKGQCICVFPEGGSHDHTSMQPLKAGVAIFTLGAAERGIHVNVVPCGLTYFYGHKFRSRGHVEFGAPQRPTEEMVKAFSLSESKREITGEFLKVLDGALRSVTINVQDWATLKFVHSFRRLYQPVTLRLETKDYLQLTRRLALITEKYGSDPEMVDFRSKLENYNDYCAALLVRDTQAATLNNLESEASIKLLIRRVMMILFLGVILVPFSLLAGPIGLILNAAAESHAKTALAASTVKLIGQDVKGSYKVILGILVVPVVMNTVAFIVYFFTDLRTALTIFFSLPMAMYVSVLIAQEFVMEVYAALPLLMSFFSKHKQFQKLYNRRQALVRSSNEIVSKFDPDLAAEMSRRISMGAENQMPAYRDPSLFSLRHSSTIPKHYKE